MDSGAARSVCPKTHGDQFGLAPSAESRRGDGFQTATGKNIPNQGSRSITGVTAAGDNFTMKYAVADVTIALDSISQICDSGATVHFHKTGGWIEQPDGSRTTFERDHDTYIRTFWVEKSPFAGQNPRDS